MTSASRVPRAFGFAGLVCFQLRHAQRVQGQRDAGKTLGCYCKPAACHGDVLARAGEWARDLTT